MQTTNIYKISSPNVSWKGSFRIGILIDHNMCINQAVWFKVLLGCLACSVAKPTMMFRVPLVLAF